MAATLSAIRDLTRLFIDDVGGDRWTDPQLLTLINSAQRDIQKVIDDADENYFSEVQACAVVPSTDSLEFALPSGLRQIILAEREVSGGRPIPAEWVDFRLRHTGSINWDYYQSMFPSSPICCLRGTKVEVIAPTESYTLRVWYTKSIADLANDTDVTEIPSEHMTLVALQAARLTKGRDSASPLPETLQQEYQDRLEQLKLFVENRQRQKPRSVNYIQD